MVTFLRGDIQGRTEAKAVPITAVSHQMSHWAILAGHPKK